MKTLITITDYTVLLQKGDVVVNYTYELPDPIATINRKQQGSKYLSQEENPLDSPSWTDEDIRVALAQSLNVDESVVELFKIPS